MEQICDRDRCSLCMACFNVCPRQAVYVECDENGYEAVRIDPEKCIDCGLCRNVCEAGKQVGRSSPRACCAAQASDQKALMRSASGGAFQMMAEAVLGYGGVCYGCTSVWDDQGLHARHLRVDRREDLPRILNSRYIPSMIGEAYRCAGEDLLAGRLVLFSGTPCQIQGLRAYLNREYENLITVDLICHGVASSRLFNDYVRAEEKKQGIRITDFSFRDKSVIWGPNFSYQYYRINDPGKRIKTRRLPNVASSYLAHYERGNILRENCYACELSGTERVSDFTIGDFWGIDLEYPQFITKCRPALSLHKGISCILINTEKAEHFVPELLRPGMILHEVSLQAIAAHNGNLRAASARGAERDRILREYREHGYDAIEREYETAAAKKIRLYAVKNRIKAVLPDRVRIWMQKCPKTIRRLFH